MYNIPAITFKVHKPYQVFKETGAFKGYSPQTLLRNLGKKKKKRFPKGFEYCPFLWFRCDIVYKWPLLIQSLCEKEIYHSFSEPPLSCHCGGGMEIFPCLSCLTLFTEDFQCLFGNWEGWRECFVHLFVQQRITSKCILSMSQKRLGSCCNMSNRSSSSITWIRVPHF